MMPQFRVAPEVREAERAKPTDELGQTGLRQFAGMVEETYLKELRYPGAYEKYNEMRRRDPSIASLLNAVRLLARPVSWEVEPAGTSEPDQRAAEFLSQCLDDMSITLEDAAEDLLTAIPFGWAWDEIVYKRRRGMKADPASKFDDNAIGWRKFAPRRQSSFYAWEFDPNGGTQGLWQSVQHSTKPIFLPIEKSIHFTAQRDMGNPEGMPLLEPSYEPWHFAKNLQIILGIGAERSFVGLPVFTYGTLENPYQPTDDDKALIERMGKALRVDEKAWVSIPGQIGFELVTVSNSNATWVLDVIKQFRIWMLMTVLADFIALGVMATGGSYALGQDKSELFLMGVDGWLDKLAHPDKLGVLNRYAVPRLFGYNMFDGITDYPRIKHSSVQKPNLPALSSYLQSLSAFITPDAVLEATLRKLANLPPPDEEQLTEGESGAPETGADENDAELSRRLKFHRGLKPRGLRYYEIQFQKAMREFQKA